MNQLHQKHLKHVEKRVLYQRSMAFAEGTGGSCTNSWIFCQTVENTLSTNSICILNFLQLKRSAKCSNAKWELKIIAVWTLKITSPTPPKPSGTRHTIKKIFLFHCRTVYYLFLLSKF